MGSWNDGTAGLVTLPDGLQIRGRGLRRDPVAPAELPEFGVYLTGRRHAEAEWESVWIRWPDFRRPRDPVAAVETLRRAHREAAGRRVEIACHGGIGRTGTALAVLARLAGVPADRAVAWVRTNYRPDAVETPGQRRFVEDTDLTG